ncbi:hypothetical protein FB451DRAFT_1410189 [Mycena latifolia]|nr:hypothetical protein FB451DRAFT_1410189 [Mycena latifolia]
MATSTSRSSSGCSSSCSASASVSPSASTNSTSASFAGFPSSTFPTDSPHVLPTAGGDGGGFGGGGSGQPYNTPQSSRLRLVPIPPLTLNLICAPGSVDLPRDAHPPAGRVLRDHRALAAARTDRRQPLPLPVVGLNRSIRHINRAASHGLFSYLRLIRA